MEHLKEEKEARSVAEKMDVSLSTDLEKAKQGKLVAARGALEQKVLAMKCALGE